MEFPEEINVIFEETKKLQELLAVDNVEAVTPDDNDVISVGEESMIEECLNDTDGSLSSVNLDFFNDDSPKPAKGRRKKTMEKRKEERLSFRYLVDDEAASDNEDGEDLSPISLFSSEYSDSSPPLVEERKLPITGEFSMASTSRVTRGTNTVKGKKVGAFKILPKMKRIHSKDIQTASTSRRDNSPNLKKVVRQSKSDKVKNSESDTKRNLDHLLNEVYVKMFKQKRSHSKIDDIKSNMKIGKGKKRLLRSKSVEELRRNYEEDESETKEDFVIPSTGKQRNVSKVDKRKRILQSPKSGIEKKSESRKEFQNMVIANEAIDDIKTSASNNANVPKMKVGGVKRILLTESDEEEKSKSSNKNLNVGKNRRKRRVSAKRQKVANNAHIYSFFSSMADLVSTLPYFTTLTAKARVTKMLEDMVERVEKWKSNTSPLKPITSHEISEEDLKLIKLRLARLPYIYVNRSSEDEEELDLLLQDLNSLNSL